MKVRGREGERHDAYAGDLIAHHIDDMPIWVFLEVIDFGTLVDFYLFCATRWENSETLQEHYVLKSVKALRDATSHSLCANAHNECEQQFRTVLTPLRM